MLAGLVIKPAHQHFRFLDNTLYAIFSIIKSASRR